MKPNWTMTAFTYGVRQIYLCFKIRIRQWGHLPAKRGATVLITNHQHMDEGEMITARTFLLHPWKPLVMCNSRRTFETGFIAARLPWTAWFTRGMNLSGLWAAYSVLPDREPSLLAAAHQPGRRVARRARRSAARSDLAGRNARAAGPRRARAERPVEARELHAGPALG